MKNTKAVGNRTEAIIFSELVKRDYTVLMPFGDNERYDLVADASGVFVRIQCKTGYDFNGAVAFPVKSTYPFYAGSGGSVRKTYTKNEIDCFMVHSPSQDKIYLVDVVNVGVSEIYLRVKDHGHSRGRFPIRWAVDYEFKDLNKIVERLNGGIA